MGSRRRKATGDDARAAGPLGSVVITVSRTGSRRHRDHRGRRSPTGDSTHRRRVRQASPAVVGEDHVDMGRRCRRIDPHGRDQDALIGHLRRNDSGRNRLDHAGGHPCLRRTPVQQPVLLTDEGRLVHEQRVRSDGQSRIGDHDERGVLVGGSRQRGGPGDARRAGPIPEHSVHVGRRGPTALEPFPDLHQRHARCRAPFGPVHGSLP